MQQGRADAQALLPDRVSRYADTPRCMRVHGGFADCACQSFFECFADARAEVQHTDASISPQKSKEKKKNSPINFGEFFVL